jgi:hypothetical protein
MQATHLRQLLRVHPAPWHIVADPQRPQCDVVDARGFSVNTFEDLPQQRTFWAGIVSAINLIFELARPRTPAEQDG